MAQETIVKEGYTLRNHDNYLTDSGLLYGSLFDAVLTPDREEAKRWMSNMHEGCEIVWIRITVIIDNNPYVGE